MKKYYLYAALIFTLCAHALPEKAMEEVIQYAEEQLNEARRILLDLHKSNPDSNTIDQITKRILDVAAERQALRLLQKYHGTPQKEHLKRLRQKYETQSSHPLLEKARNLQQELA